MVPRPLSSMQVGVLQTVFRLLQKGRPADALRLAQELALGAPDAPDALHALAMCLARTGRAEQSDAAFRSALVLAPDQSLILANYAAMWRQAGDPKRAMPIAKRAVAAAPSSGKAWSDLALTAQATGSHALAMQAAGRAVELEPASVGAWWTLGRAARACEELEIAIEAFQRVVELDPGNTAGHVALAEIFRRCGQAGRAIDSLESAIQRSGANAPLTDALSGALLDAGRVEDAIAMAKRTVHEYPDFIPSLSTLSSLLWEHGDAERDADEPAELFRKAVARAPEDIERRAAFAHFLAMTEAYEAALEQVRWLRARADGLSFALMEARALDRLGRVSEARSLFDRILRSEPHAPPGVFNAFASHLLRSGEPAGAASSVEAVLATDPTNQEAWAYLSTAWRLLDDPREFWLCDYDRLIGTVEIEPPSPFKDRSAFVAALAGELEALHRARREPMQQSLREGSQTPGRLFGRESATIDATRQSMLRGVERWMATLPTDPAHPFLGRRRPHVRIGGSWSVRLRASGRHINHFHSEGWMSSAFYVALPPSVGAGRGDAGAIQFGQPPVEFGLDLAPRRTIQPSVGTLVLFPSYMWHGTVPFDDASPRLTIAFDMTPSDR